MKFTSREDLVKKIWGWFCLALLGAWVVLGIAAGEYRQVALTVFAVLLVVAMSLLSLTTPFIQARSEWRNGSSKRYPVLLAIVIALAIGISLGAGHMLRALFH
ncbi:MAG: hypothetical protein Q8Q73_15440 [Stagnimonas sp.]|nr:hypothetical protein [Stagnimonas sp.]